MLKILILINLSIQLCKSDFQIFNTDRQYEFHGLIFPNLNKMGKPIIWYIQMICRQGCNSHSKYFSTLTSDTIIDAGKFTFNLMAESKRKGGYEDINLISIKITSLDEISNKFRSYTWEYINPEFTKLHFFQFGHFESKTEEGFYLEFKFNKENKLLIKQNKNLNISFVNYFIRIKAKQNNSWFKSSKYFGYKNNLTNDELKGEKSFKIYLGGNNIRIIKNKTSSFWPFSSSNNNLNIEPIDKYLRENILPSMELIIEQIPNCGICGENNEADVYKLKGCNDYFHKNCIKNLLNTHTPHESFLAGIIGNNASEHLCPICRRRIILNIKRNDVLYDDNTKIERKQYRHELKNPILQNGENPFYKYKFDPTNQQREYNKIDYIELQNGIYKSKREYEFHIKVSPNIRNVGNIRLPIIWLIQLDCLIGCNKYLNTQILQTSDNLNNFGKVVFYLLAELNNEIYQNITNLKIKITSLDKLAGKLRSNTWENVIPEFGKEHHFQFGHYETISGFYLQFKLDLNYYLPLLMDKDEVGARPVKYKAKIIASGLFCNKILFGNIIEVPDNALKGKSFKINLGGEQRIIPYRKPLWKFSSLFNCVKDEKINIFDYLKNKTFPSMELIIEQMPVCGRCGEKAFGEVIKLKSCSHYFHPECINNYIIKKGIKKHNNNEISNVYISNEDKCPLCLRGLLIDDDTQLALFDDDKIQYRQFRHYLKNPILQNGENPKYTYKIGLDKKQKNYNLVSTSNFGSSNSNESPETNKSPEIAPQSKGKKIVEENIRKIDPFGEGTSTSRRIEDFNEDKMSLNHQILRSSEIEVASSRELESIKSPMSPTTFERIFQNTDVEPPVEKKNKLSRFFSEFLNKPQKQKEEKEAKNVLMDKFLSNTRENYETGTIEPVNEEELLDYENVKEEELVDDEQIENYIRQGTNRINKKTLNPIPEITEDELSSSPLIRKRINKNKIKESSDNNNNDSEGHISNNYIPPDRRSTTNSSSNSLEKGSGTPTRYALSKTGSSVQSNSVGNESPLLSNNELRKGTKSPLSSNNHSLQHSSSGKESINSFASAKTYLSSENNENPSLPPSPLPSVPPSPFPSPSPSPQFKEKTITSYTQKSSISPLLIRKKPELEESTRQIYQFNDKTISEFKEININKNQLKNNSNTSSSSSHKTPTSSFFSTADDLKIERTSSNSSLNSDKSVIINNKEEEEDNNNIIYLQTPFYTPLNIPLNTGEIQEEEIIEENNYGNNLDTTNYSTGEETPLIISDQNNKKRGYSMTELKLDLELNKQKIKDFFKKN